MGTVPRLTPPRHVGQTSSALRRGIQGSGPEGGR
jgi:hypothetical protein